MENYIKNTLINPSAVNSRLSHPITGFKYPNRDAFDLLKNYADNFFKDGSEPRLIGLAGLRGVGKTTLLWQIGNYIYENFSKNVYFLNVNIIKGLNGSLFEALEVFQKKIFKKHFIESAEPIVLLIDEVQDDADWANTLKILYDEARWCFAIVTGSSALLLNKTADLSRRMYILKIFPFKFTEFIAAKTFSEEGILTPKKSIATELNKAIFFSESSKEVIEKLNSLKPDIDDYLIKLNNTAKSDVYDLIDNFINYQNIPIFLSYKDENLINDSIIELLKRVILEDIPKISRVKIDSNSIEKILYRLAASDEINIDNLSKTYGIKKSEISEIINLLDKAELINLLLAFGGIDSKQNKIRKAFFMSPSLRRALLSALYGNDLPQNYISKLFEDLVVLYLKQILPNTILSYSSDEKGLNPDIIIETRNKPILLEIGLNKKSNKQIEKSKINFRYGIIVSYHNNELMLKDNTIYIPFLWFLML